MTPNSAAQAGGRDTLCFYSRHQARAGALGRPASGDNPVVGG